MIKIYGKPDCPYCDRAKSFLEARGIDYQYLLIGTDVEMGEFREEFPAARSVPQIIVDDVKIGGYTDLVEFFKKTP